MKILIIGGTSFVGRHITEEAIKKGHETVLFNRGKSQPSAFPELRHIKGDRRKDAGKLSDEKWDAVIDTSAYSPSDLEPVLKAVRTDRYVFISTISVYRDFSDGPVTEDGALHEARPASDEVTSETYGPLKVMCEEAVRSRFGEEALIIRPGIVIGPHDPTDRFTYWAQRLAETGRAAVPVTAGRKVQWIDARDLARFVIEKTEDKTAGTFNVTADPAEMETFIKETVEGTGPEFVQVPDSELIDFGIRPFELPLWLPVSEEYPEGFLLADNSKAKLAGLAFRPLSVSARDTRMWLSTTGKKQLSAGISREQEKALVDRKT